jgi:hypothetical protein
MFAKHLKVETGPCVKVVTLLAVDLWLSRAHGETLKTAYQ